MNITLYIVNPDTRKYAGISTVNEWTADKDPALCSPQEVWELAGNTGTVLGSLYAPPGDDYLFDGIGWINAHTLSAALAISLVKEGRLTVHAVTSSVNATILMTELRVALQRVPSVASPYSPAEQATWPQQIAEAKRIVSGDQSDTPLLTALAKAENRNIEDLALSVLTKSEATDKQTAQALITYNSRRKSMADAFNLLLAGKTDEAVQRAFDLYLNK